MTRPVTTIALGVALGIGIFVFGLTVIQLIVMAVVL